GEGGEGSWEEDAVKLRHGTLRGARDEEKCREERRETRGPVEPRESQEVFQREGREDIEGRHEKSFGSLCGPCGFLHSSASCLSPVSTGPLVSLRSSLTAVPDVSEEVLRLRCLASSRWKRGRYR